jgi:hypothetical protein
MVDSIQRPNRPDVVAVESTPRPTPTPARVPFKQVLTSLGMNAAKAAMNVMPGAPLVATALRGPALPVPAPGLNPLSLPIAGHSALAPAVSLTPEGPGGVGVSAGIGGGLGGVAGDPQSALGAAQASEMQMLELQQEVTSQQNAFMTLSNIYKSESDTEKTAIQNIK